MQKFEDFKKKYETKLENDEVINILLDNEIKDYIINNDDGSFLAKIICSSNDELRKFYFNEQTIPYIIEQKKFGLALFRNDFFPNKIKMFNDDNFLKYIILENYTSSVILNIKEEIKKQPDNLYLLNTLKKGLYKFIDYLKQDLKNNIKDIFIFMEELPSQIYKEFLDYIKEDIKNLANQEDISFDQIFYNSYIYYSSKFEDIFSIINSFKGTNKLYYSKELMCTLIKTTTDYKNCIIIDKQQMNNLKNYIFNNYGKTNILANLDDELIEILFNCFKNDTIDYFFDDEGLIILDNNKKFNELFFNYSICNKLTQSKNFAILLKKNYKVEDFDNEISKIENKSLFNLLDIYIKLNDYEYFFRVFNILDSNNQLLYLKNNLEELLKINNNDIFKGIKKEGYELFKEKINPKDWLFIDYDLYNIIKMKKNYSIEQIKFIFSNKENVFTILKGNYMQKTYNMILNLNIPTLNNIYMSEESLSILRNLNRLDEIYKIINDLQIDISNLLLNKNCLIEIGEEIKKISKNNFLKNNDTKYFYFFSNIPKLKNKDILFKILDFYLENKKYLSTFYILRNELENQTLKEYLDTRKDLITKIIQENKCDSSLILGNLPKNIIKDEFFYERENLAIHFDFHNYYDIFSNEFKGKYKLNEKVLNEQKFIEKFIDNYKNVEDHLRLVTNNEELIKKLTIKTKFYSYMKRKIINNLNDSIEEFKIYLKILINSGINIYEIEFLKDMIDVIFFNKRVKEVYLKYKNKNLEKIKLEILNNIIKNSQENIINSLTNPLKKNIIYTEYKINEQIVLIPTIIYEKENYNFLVRRMQSAEHLFDGTYKSKIEYYSTITEKNRSVFYGDSGIKFGYIKVNPEDIIQVNSIDAISYSTENTKYTSALTKYPEWVSIDELNKRTLMNESYNELRIKGKYIPDFVVCYDEPNKATLNYSYKHNTPIVKILRKSYPDAIEYFNDPYSNL